MNRCAGLICAIKNDSTNGYFYITLIEPIHIYQSDQLQNEHHQANSQLIGEHLMDKFQNTERI